MQAVIRVWNGSEYESIGNPLYKRIYIDSVTEDVNTVSMKFEKYPENENYPVIDGYPIENIYFDDEIQRVKISIVDDSESTASQKEKS